MTAMYTNADADLEDYYGGDIDDLAQPMEEVEDVVEDLENQGPQQQEDEEEEDAGTIDDKTAAGPSDEVAVKRRVLGPRPKLNADRLTGPSGIGALAKTAEGMKLKTEKGSEVENLNLIMSSLEMWAHRLMPSIRYDEALKRCETLGSVRQVQGHLNQLRMGLHDYGTGDLHDEDAVENIAVDGEDGAVLPQQVDDADAAFDEAMAVAMEMDAAQPAPAPARMEVTEEQRRRMEANRERALALRKARLEKQKAMEEGNEEVMEEVRQEETEVRQAENAFVDSDDGEELDEIAALKALMGD